MYFSTSSDVLDGERTFLAVSRAAPIPSEPFLFPFFMSSSFSGEVETEEICFFSLCFALSSGSLSSSCVSLLPLLSFSTLPSVFFFSSPAFTVDFLSRAFGTPCTEEEGEESNPDTVCEGKGGLFNKNRSSVSSVFTFGRLSFFSPSFSLLWDKWIAGRVLSSSRWNEFFFFCLGSSGESGRRKRSSLSSKDSPLDFRDNDFFSIAGDT